MNHLSPPCLPRYLVRRNNTDPDHPYDGCVVDLQSTRYSAVLAHARAELLGGVAAMIEEETTQNPTWTVQQLADDLNRKYMNGPGYYVVVHFNWRGEPHQAQLSHPAEAYSLLYQCFINMFPLLLKAMLWVWGLDVCNEPECQWQKLCDWLELEQQVLTKVFLVKWIVTCMFENPPSDLNSF